MTRASGRETWRRSPRPAPRSFRPWAELLEGRELLTGGGTLTTFDGPYAFATSVATGTDGNLYVANSGYAGNGSITALKADGTPLATYPLPANHDGAYAIAAGSDGGIWTIGGSKIDRLAPDGTIASYAGGTGGEYLDASSLVAGADGSAWFVDTGSGHFNFTAEPIGWITDTPSSIGHITPDGTITYYPVADGKPSNLTIGPGGSVAFSIVKADGSQAIGQIAADKTLGETPLPSDLAAIYSLTAGPDGNLWFLSDNAFSFTSPDPVLAPVIGRLTPSGSLSTFAFTPNSTGLDEVISPPRGLVSAPDGNLYFLDNGAIGRVTTAGVVSEAAVPLPYGRQGDAIGPDSNLWIAINDTPTNPGVAVYTLDGSDAGFVESPPPPVAPPSTPPADPTPVADPIAFPILLVDPFQFSGPVAAPISITHGVATLSPASGVVPVAAPSPADAPAIVPGAAAASAASPITAPAPAISVESARVSATVPVAFQAAALPSSPSPTPSSTGSSQFIPLEIAEAVTTVGLESSGSDALPVVGHKLGRPSGLTRVADSSRAGA